MPCAAVTATTPSAAVPTTTFYGGDGNDKIYGDVGDDNLDGGASSDILRVVTATTDPRRCGGDSLFATLALTKWTVVTATTPCTAMTSTVLSVTTT